MGRMEVVDRMEELIIDSLGAEQALTDILLALDYEVKEDIFSYIIRMHGLEPDTED